MCKARAGRVWYVPGTQATEGDSLHAAISGRPSPARVAARAASVSSALQTWRDAEMHSIVFLLVITASWCAVSLGDSHTGAHDTAPAVVEARRARDHADMATLQRLIEDARTRAAHTSSFDDYAHTALCADGVCEAAYAQQNERLVKHAARTSMRAAEHAVQINPGSARAH